MESNIKEDLILFNELIDVFLKDEQKNPVSNIVSTTELYEKLDFSLQEEPMILPDYKNHLKNLILNTPKSSSKLFFNQLFGGRQSKAVLGDLLAVFLNNSMATYKIAGAQVGVEKEIINKVCEIIGYGNKSGGTFPTGGSMSNFMSLIMARDKKDTSIKDKGINQKLIAYGSKNAHYSLEKNISFSGIGKDNIRYIDTNNKGEIIAKELERQLKKDIDLGYYPFYLNATAGTTVMCAFDKIKELSDICKEHNVWLHVDGAFGGAVIFSNRHKDLIEGVSKSDSFCFNAHKTLGAPLSTSVLVVKNKKNLYNSFSNKATYLYQTHNEEFNLGQTSFECGRRNNALKFWTMWKAIGTKGIEKIVDRQFELADFARKYVINNTNYQLYSFDDSLSVCFNYKDIDPKDLCTKLYENNKLMIGFGSFNDDTFLRLVTINNQVSKKDIKDFFDILESFVSDNIGELKKTETNN